MTIRLDPPQHDIQVVVVAAIQARADLRALFGLRLPMTLSQPIQRHRYTVQRDGRAFRFGGHTRTDYFVLGSDAVAIASARHDGDKPYFTRLLGGELPKRLLSAMARLESEFGSSRRVFTLRIFENFRAKLVSVVLMPASGQGFFVNVLDGALIDEEKLVITGGFATLRARALTRLTMPSN